jgi:hypothetical protein
MFHVYDIPRAAGDDTCLWGERFNLLDKAFYGMLYESKIASVITVATYEAKTEEEVYKLQSQFLEEGYEGAIVREMDGEYRFGNRSNKLLKVKNFMDKEYTIMDFTTGVGRFEGCCIWICETKDGQPFKVVPQGTMEERQEAYLDADENIGRMLKVKYFELTDDGIPRFPVGLGIRLLEDM